MKIALAQPYPTLGLLRRSQQPSQDSGSRVRCTAGRAAASFSAVARVAQGGDLARTATPIDLAASKPGHAAKLLSFAGQRLREELRIMAQGVPGS